MPARLDLGLQDFDIGRVIGAQAFLLRMDADDDGAAILAVGTRAVGRQRLSQRCRNRDPALVIDKTEAVSLIFAPIVHAYPAPVGQAPPVPRIAGSRR